MPVKLIVPALAFVKYAPVPVRVNPPFAFKVPVVNESLSILDEDEPPVTVIKPPTVKVPLATASSLALVVLVLAASDTAPVTVSVTPPAIVNELALVPPVNEIDATVTLTFPCRAIVALAIVTVSVVCPAAPG